MDEAVAWVKRCPNPMPGPSEIEIRPLYEMADFGEALTPEVAELHERVREKAGGEGSARHPVPYVIGGRYAFARACRRPGRVRPLASRPEVSRRDSLSRPRCAGVDRPMTTLDAAMSFDAEPMPPT